jgi:outer membrane protein assembly factor BamB
LYGYPTACAPGRCRPTWIAKPGGDLTTATPTVAGGVVYVGSTDGTLSAYPIGCDSYPRPCRPRWTARLRGGFGERGYAGAQPAVADGAVFVGSTGGTLYVFPTSCRSPCAPVREVKLKGPMNNPLVVAGGTLYVTSANHLFAFPTRCLDRGGRCVPDWIGTAPALIVSTPAVGGGNVYVGSDADVVSVFSQHCARHGGACKPAWTIPDLGRLPNPSYFNGVVFVGSTWSRNELLAFDADCGASGKRCTPLWSFVVPDLGSISQTAVSDGHTLFAATGDLLGASQAGGSVFAFRVGAGDASAASSP